MDEQLKELAGPYEIFELEDGQSIELRVIRWEIGAIRIQTSDVPQGKDVKALRLYLTAASKPIGVNWYDITSKTLIAQIYPYLELPGYEAKVFKITKYGVRPKARFMVQVS